MTMTTPTRLRRAVAVGSLVGLAVPLLGPAVIAPAATAPRAMAAPAALAVPTIAGSPELAIAAADAAVSAELGAISTRAHESYVRGDVDAGPNGRQYVTYERAFKGLPVVGGEVVVTADGAGSVRDVSNATAQSSAVSTTRPTVPASAAQRTVTRSMASVSDTKPARLVVKLLPGAAPRLAWHVQAEGTTKQKAPAVLNVYVDALNGEVLDSENLVRDASGQGHHNGNVSFTTTGSGSSFSMTSTAAPGLKCGGQNGSAYTGPDDAWGNGSGTNLETACVDVMYAGEVETKMLRDWTGRNGMDGQGRAFPARVGLADVNAYWNGSYTNFGHNQANTKQATPMDVVAHENGHGLFQFSGSGGAGSGNEAGGLNESTGDILGAATEAFANNSSDPFDYEVGEEVDLVGDGPIRYMHDPSVVGDPNCYSSSIPGTEVHAAAGPQNHWFYLLAEGNNPGGGKPTSPICSGGPSSVTGIGVQKAVNIFVNGLQRKTSPWTHAKARVAMLQSAKDLYTGSCTEFNTVKAAWEAVSVRAQSGEPTCTASSNDYSLAINPTSGSVTPGSSTTVTVTTQTTAGDAQTVALSASGLPSGASASFSPASVQSGSSSTLTIATTASTPAGTYTVSVLGDGVVDRTASYALTVGNGNPEPTDPPDVDLAKMQAHLQQFQTIATNNGGNRRAGSAGYTASVSYVEQKLTAAGFTVARQRCTSCTYPSDNLIADWPGGDATKTYLFGAHLDGVSAGPGINDNGSGSAALLENALSLATEDPTMLNHVRFAWWTDEEQGLNGSNFYVSQLSSTQRSDIEAYYNFDMVGSTNGGYFINHINTAAAAPMKAYWDSLNLQPEENVEGAGRSDDYSFEQAGIATSGYAMGASARKTSAQVTKWGGTANSAYDPCYHASCDKYPANINTTGLNRSADGIAYTIWAQAVSDGPPTTDDFSVAVSPASGTATAGQSVTTTISTAVTSGADQSLSFSAAGLPTGATATFSPASVQTGQSSTVTIATSATTPAGTYPVSIRAAGATTKSSAYSLTVNGGGGGGTCPGKSFSNSTDYPIRDRATSTSIINGSCTGQVTTARVAYDILHTCEEDFAVFLVAPDGRRYTLETSGYGPCGTRNGTLTKNVAVSAVAGQGSWKLEVRDDYAGDTGTLRGWTLTF